MVPAGKWNDLKSHPPAGTTCGRRVGFAMLIRRTSLITADR